MTKNRINLTNKISQMMKRKIILLLIIGLIFCDLYGQNESIKKQLSYGLIVGNDLTIYKIEDSKYGSYINPKYGIKVGLNLNLAMNKNLEFETGLLFCNQGQQYKSNTTFIYPDGINPLYGSLYKIVPSNSIYDYPQIFGMTRISSILVTLASIHKLNKIPLYFSPAIIMNFWVQTKTIIDNNESYMYENYTYNMTNIGTDDKYFNHFKIGCSARIGMEQKIKNFIIKYEPNITLMNLINMNSNDKKGFFYTVGLNLIFNFKK